LKLANNTEMRIKDHHFNILNSPMAKAVLAGIAAHVAKRMMGPSQRA
jgi:hypothetical protein